MGTAATRSPVLAALLGMAPATPARSPSTDYPPWLLELLKKHQSAGMVDTLQALVGKPNFVQLPDQGKGGGQVGARFFGDALGQPQMGLTPFLMANFDKPGRMYQSVADRLGVAAIPHEFGHMAVSTAGNVPLNEALLKEFPNALKDEQFANDFSTAFQHLRTGEADLGKLKKNPRKIAEILLTQPIYSQHAANAKKEKK